MADGQIKVEENRINQIELPINILRQGSQIVIYSPALDLCSSGDSREQASQNFSDAVLIFMEDLVEQGILGDVLEELGWRFEKSEWTPPAWECSQYQSINVPIAA